MKRFFSIYCSLIAVFFLGLPFAAVAQEVKKSPIHSRDNTQDRYFYCNPLTLDGFPLVLNKVNTDMIGQLNLWHGNPGSEEATKVKFKVYLKRNGAKVENTHMDFIHQEYYDLDLSRILRFSQPGDQIVIEPVHPEDWRAKRIIPVNSPFFSNSALSDQLSCPC